jgi:cytoskeletal protein RodZ
MSGQTGQPGQPENEAGSDGEPTSIGARLARAREAAELSVAELSELTRIREPVIYAIERDDFSISGGDFYARGHIRNIAKVVGLDTESIVHEYDDLHGGIPLPVRAADVFQAEIPIKLRERRTFNWTAAMALLLIIVVVFGAVRMMSGSGDLRSAGLRAGTGGLAAKSQHRAGGSGAKAKPYANAAEATSMATPPAADEVAVQIRAERTTWVNIRDAKGRRLFRGTLDQGNSSTWKAKDRIDVEVQDAGAVRMEVNGRDLGVPGKNGERIQRTYGTGVPPAQPQPNPAKSPVKSPA